MRSGRGEGETKRGLQVKFQGSVVYPPGRGWLAQGAKRGRPTTPSPTSAFQPESSKFQFPPKLRVHRRSPEHNSKRKKTDQRGGPSQGIAFVVVSTEEFNTPPPPPQFPSDLKKIYRFPSSCVSVSVVVE